MKRLFALVLAATLVAPTIAAAGFQGPNSVQGGGFQGPTTGIEADTVAKAQKSWDDARVVLTGNITQRVAGSDDKYIFKDTTGEMIVEIDFELFAGRTVTPQNKVRLSGKVDKDFMESTKVDVKVLEIL